MSSHFFSGVTTALITPFIGGEIDFSSLGKLIRHQLDNEIKGFVVCGSTGEAATLSLEEKKKLLDFVLAEVAGAVPVLFGSGTNNTAETINLTKTFGASNIAGFLVVTPYYNKPPQRGLIEHFNQVALAADKPIIVYNVPSRTAVSMTVETVLALSKNSNIWGIKEATGDLTVMKKLVKRSPRKFSLISGDDETFLEAMRLGAHGVISVISHVAPKLCVSATLKDVKKIKSISKNIFIESNPIPVKWVLKEMGIIDSDELRLPLVPLDKKLQGTVKKDLKKLGVL